MQHLLLKSIKNPNISIKNPNITTTVHKTEGAEGGKKLHLNNSDKMSTSDPSGMITIKM